MLRLLLFTLLTACSSAPPVAFEDMGPLPLPDQADAGPLVHVSPDGSPLTRRLWFLLIGQSNMVGQGLQHQLASYVLPPCAFMGDDRLHCGQLDPIGAAVPGWVNPVNKNTAAGGSAWPHFVTFASQDPDTADTPIGFIPAAVDGSAIVWWRPSPNPLDTTSLLGAAMSQTLQALTEYGGELGGVLYLQGEIDAINKADPAVYLADLQLMGDAVWEALHVPLLVGVIGTWAPTCTAPSPAGIQGAQRKSWYTNHILPGADLSDMTPYQCLHFVTDPDLTEIGRRWYLAAVAAGLLS